MPEGKGTYGSKVGRPPKKKGQSLLSNKKSNKKRKEAFKEEHRKLLITDFLDKYEELQKAREAKEAPIAKKFKDMEDNYVKLLKESPFTQEDVNEYKETLTRVARAEGGLEVTKSKYKTKGFEIDFDLTPEQKKVIQNTAKGFEVDIELTPKQIAVTKETSKRMEAAFFKKLGNIFNVNRTSKAEGGDINSQMGMMLEGEEKTSMEEPMIPDEQMEEDYVDYVMEETLSNEDRNYLISALEKDDRLSEIFDQVVESATEFSGSGPIEGPGNEKSDSIPARLSDGEFVFTAKASEEIGEDNLMSMMKDAEASADQRQGVAYGGMVEEEGDPKAVPIQTTGSQTAQRNVPNVVKPNRQVEEEMLKASPRRYYVPLSG